MSRRTATLLTLALSLEVMCVVGRMSRLPDVRAANAPVEIVASERPKSRPTA
jgi:hypothetical protein